MLTFSQYRIEQALNIQADMLRRNITTDVLGIKYYLIDCYTGYLRIIGAEDVLIEKISELTMASYSENELNNRIDELVTKNQAEHNDY